MRSALDAKGIRNFEVLYDPENGDLASRATENQNRPDAIAYRIIDDGKLEILAVLEAKVGKSKFNRSQFVGWLNRWKLEGISIEDEFYDPDQIIGLNKIEAHFYLAAHNSPRNLRSIRIEPSLSPDTQRKLSIRFIGRVIDRSGAASQRMIERLNKKRQRDLQPLIEWMTKNERFPNKRADEPIERSLGWWVRNQGGQLNVYNSLPPELKAKITVPIEIKDEAERRPELIEWMTKNERFPKQMSVDPIERSLGKWVNRQGGQLNVYDSLPTELKAKIPAPISRARNTCLEMMTTVAASTP